MSRAKKKAPDPAPEPTVPREEALAVLEAAPKAAEDYYRKLRRRMRRWLAKPDGKAARWAEYLLFAPDLFHLVFKLALDPEVRLANRMRLAAVVAYFMSPLDLVPEMIAGPFGFLDDIALAAYVLHRLVNTTDRVIVERHWAGEGDLLALLKRILADMNAMLGGLIAGRIERLARWVPKRGAKPGP